MTLPMYSRSTWAICLAAGVLSAAHEGTVRTQVQVAVPADRVAVGQRTSAAAAAEPVRRVQTFVDDLRGRLNMPQSVRVSLVAQDTRVASVRRVEGHPEAFRLSLVEEFLQHLVDDEVLALIAHELGHVWIFTHHPYLQTEELANEIALQVVERESLERLYEKVWRHVGTEGHLSYFRE